MVDQGCVCVQDYKQHERIVMRRTVKFTQSGIASLPENKPVIYRIETDGGKDNYVGVAKRGRVQERIQEHLPGTVHAIPGSKVQVVQMPSIQEAVQKERKIIEREQPKYNKRHK